MQILRELKKLFVFPSFAMLVGRSAYLCFMLLLGTLQLRADVTGSISGYVRDASGGVLPNATLTIIQTATGYTRTAATDGSGHYNILALPPGSYRLTATNAGFENGVVDKITLNVNDELKFDFDLKVGNVSQTVSVDASTVQVDTANTSMGTTISSSQILSMPLNGRSYLDLLSLQPGVAPSNTTSTYNDRAPASGLYGSSGTVSTDGQPEWANAFLVNGAEVNETKNMGAGMIPDADSVAEFRLITNSFSAEYGKFTGSVMNTVTKSGTNSFHGTLFEFYRNQKLNAINYLDSSKAELKRHQFGGVLGGPIWKDKLFTFTDYQQTRQVAGASTGFVQVLSNDERNGIFSDAILNTPVQGDAWAATLMSRGGGTINGAGGVCQAPCTPTKYNQLGTPVMTTDATGATVPGHNISAYLDPVSKLTLPIIPVANQPDGFHYDDSTHKGSIIDTNMAERIDFVNHKTGDWSFYYHYDDATAIQPVYSQATTNPGLPTLPGYPVTQPSRNQLFVLSNTKTIGATTVNVARIQFFRSAVHTAQPASPRTLNMGSIRIPPRVAWLTVGPLDTHPRSRHFGLAILRWAPTG
jgi:Carboxypeptidase regulatory-like domain